MFKRVNVITKKPIKTIKPNILNSVNDVELSVGDIRRLLYARARVEEILPDGSVINLTIQNYNKDNYVSNDVHTTKEVEVQSKVSEESKVDEDKKETSNEQESVEKENKEQEESKPVNKNNNQNNNKKNNKK